MTELYIKNMICRCCIHVVKMEVEKAGCTPITIDLGIVKVKEDLTDKVLDEISIQLQKYGLGLINTFKSIIVEKIKTIVIRYIHSADILPQKIDWYNIISSQLSQKYSSNQISRLFPIVEGVTLEHFIIIQKTRRAEELIFQNEFTLTEISKKLGYANLPHLSGQFKKVTGFTPTQYKAQRVERARKTSRSKKAPPSFKPI
ncbi:Helix-turn-helix domain-containing protein [Daejeonella rubra]|uniref:Helix-turn-helix domain-containing protein n=2 Tax=Daejeonella rubra TaxID=990371 RepID=A0A1G9NMP2_9SPHI|nr:Helix-turn-helix domain-containing protein [Daejeonella rubra]